MTYINQQRMRLGEERLTRFTTAHAMVNAQLMFLTMAMGFARDQDWSDEFLDVLVHDARDVQKAAVELRKTVEEIAEHWRAQRQEHRP